MTRVRLKVLRALRTGISPIEIARKLHIPLLLVAEVIAWQVAIREAGGSTFDF